MTFGDPTPTTLRLVGWSQDSRQVADDVTVIGLTAGDQVVPYGDC